MTRHLPLPAKYVIDPHQSQDLKELAKFYVQDIREWVQELEAAARAKAEQEVERESA